MSPGWTFVCLLIGFAMFVFAAVIVRIASGRHAPYAISLVAAGLAAWIFPALWAAGHAM